MGGLEPVFKELWCRTVDKNPKVLRAYVSPQVSVPREIL